jgi:hypothetical protein
MADVPPARNRLLAALRTDPAAEAQLREGLESVELRLHAGASPRPALSAPGPWENAEGLSSLHLQDGVVNASEPGRSRAPSCEGLRK